MSTFKMPLFACHKQVRAAEIATVDRSTRRIQVQYPVPEGHEGPEQGFIARTVMIEDNWLEKFDPKPGDFLVEYADGYRSVSPAGPFNTGYEAIGEDDADDSWRQPEPEHSSDPKSPEQVNDGGAGVQGA